MHLRLGLPHAALAQIYGVDRSTVSAAVREVRPLLAARGFAVPDRLGLRLRTLEDVFAYVQAEGVDLRIEGTEVQVRRPSRGSPRPQGVRLRQEEAEHGQDRTTTFGGFFPPSSASWPTTPASPRCSSSSPPPSPPRCRRTNAPIRKCTGEDSRTRTNSTTRPWTSPGSAAPAERVPSARDLPETGPADGAA
ncbi:helix-turn-helix domain-containing protein [Streptomyces sp. NPDC001153]